MKIATAFALLALVAVLSFMTDTGRAAIPPNAARSVMVSHGAHGEGRGVARIASRPTISKTLWKRRYAIKTIFGAYGDQAIRVAQCESSMNPWAHNKRGGYKGLFQMGPGERKRWGHGSGAWAQARAAYAYFAATGFDWSPWDKRCHP